MNPPPRSTVSCLLVFLAACLGVGAGEPVTFRTDTAEFTVGSDASLAAVVPSASGRNRIAPGQPSPLLQVRSGGRWHPADAAEWDEGARRFTLRFGDTGISADVAVGVRPSHVTMELVALGPADRVDVVLWGPYPTDIRETVGEIVGVVRDRSDAVGIQALNVRTLGGYPHQENDIVVEHGADDPGHYPGMPDELRRGQGFRGDTARLTPFGSVLQAFSRDRTRARVIANWGHERYVAPALDDGGLLGSRIALFACPEPQALGTIGEIEVAEGLPHPMLDGEWAKVARGATASYLIVDFGEDTLDRAVEMTRRAGLRHLYHSSPFAEWGHFPLKPALFPGGWDGFRRCVDRARAAGVDLGVHTLSNFITPGDAHVTPVPDPRLAVVGGTVLGADVDPGAGEIPVEDPSWFVRKSALNTVRIGGELVRFGAVSSDAPYRLTGCERGAWGTRAAAHPRGARVERLLDHDYKVFLGDAGLSVEIARRIAEFCNRTGVRQLSFDGLEGNWASGHGQYGRTLFTWAWHEALDPGLRGAVINDASNPGHLNWHINTRMNWGEPWYAGFRESQTLYRFRNQLLFERNLMPRMLGWFALRPDTGIEDAEWLLARAAGFDAGFALATSLASTAQLAADPGSADTVRRFGAVPEILATVARWEGARMARAFPPEVRALLRDNTREFHLDAAGPGAWTLHEVFVSRFEQAAGDAGAGGHEYRGAAGRQPPGWILRTDSKQPVTGVRLEWDGRVAMDLAARAIPPGGAVRYTGGDQAVVHDAAWREVDRVPVDAGVVVADGSPARVRLRAVVPDGARITVELRALGPAIGLRASRPGDGR